MGYGVGHRTYHTAVVKGPITKSIVPKTPIMVEEAQLALDALIGAPTGRSSTTIHSSPHFEPICLYDVITMTVARVTNRIYVGTEFCRNTSYLRHAADYAQAVVLSAEFLRVFPEWLKPYGGLDQIVTKFLPVTSHRQKAEKFLSKFIQDRLDGTASKNGEKPTDLVQWLIDAAPPIEKTISQLAERVMALNVASIHTTTMITASTLTKLEKMDSFLRESGRCNNLGLTLTPVAMQRNARQEFKFSDGTIIPAGAKLGSPSLILHMDPEVYTNPETFDGFRFCRHPGAVEESWKTIVTTGSNFHVFGSGRHPCPGRFLAAHEMKILFSLLLLRYDMKLVPGTKPQPFYIATMPIPDTQLQVLFKARE
ncbi:cytochrome P450 [Thozetella sp. PMI_491]|nr:cytochrome P450 [Thozetella sp. PMI_491]